MKKNFKNINLLKINSLIFFYLFGKATFANFADLTSENVSYLGFSLPELSMEVHKDKTNEIIELEKKKEALKSQIEQQQNLEKEKQEISNKVTSNKEEIQMKNKKHHFISRNKMSFILNNKSSTFKYDKKTEVQLVLDLNKNILELNMVNAINNLEENDNKFVIPFSCYADLRLKCYMDYSFINEENKEVLSKRIFLDKFEHPSNFNKLKFTVNKENTKEFIDNLNNLNNKKLFLKINQFPFWNELYDFEL